MLASSNTWRQHGQPQQIVKNSAARGLAPTCQVGDASRHIVGPIRYCVPRSSASISFLLCRSLPVALHGVHGIGDVVRRSLLVLSHGVSGVIALPGWPRRMVYSSYNGLHFGDRRGDDHPWRVRRFIEHHSTKSYQRAVSEAVSGAENAISGAEIDDLALQY